MVLARGGLSQLGGGARAILRDSLELFRGRFVPAVLRDLLTQPRMREQALGDGR
jgi:hypothetical protein